MLQNKMFDRTKKWSGKNENDSSNKERLLRIKIMEARYWSLLYFAGAAGMLLTPTSRYNFQSPPGCFFQITT
jgi:hypothetical protein